MAKEGDNKESDSTDTRAFDTADSPPTSVLLPTTRWTDAGDEVSAQLCDGDELLVIDDDSDPVAGRTDAPAGVRLVAAGEPEGCSGKANAIAAGMETARHDRIVSTDDDFHHPQTGWRLSPPTMSAMGQCLRCHTSSGETLWRCY